MVKKFEKDVMVRICLSNFLFTFFGNYQLALLNLMETKDYMLEFKDDFMIFCSMNEIEIYLEDINEK